MHKIQFSSTCVLRLARQVPRLIAVATTLVFSGIGAYAQQPQQAPEARIVVTGEGSVSVTPNYAQIRNGVTTRTKTVKEGVDANTKLMVAIIAALKDAGIAEKDIQTARFSIQPIYAPQQPGTEQKLSGYSVSNQVRDASPLSRYRPLQHRLVAFGRPAVVAPAGAASSVPAGRSQCQRHRSE